MTKLSKHLIGIGKTLLTSAYIGIGVQMAVGGIIAFWGDAVTVKVTTKES